MDINATLLGQCITFAIFIWFVMRYVWPPITQTMQDRANKIAAAIEAAERSQYDLEVAENKAKTIVHDAKHQATQIIEQAHLQAAKIVEAGKMETNRLVEQIKQRADEDIAQHMTQAQDTLRTQLAALVIAALEKITHQQLNATAHASILNQFLHDEWQPKASDNERAN